MLPKSPLLGRQAVNKAIIPHFFAVQQGMRHHGERCVENTWIQDEIVRVSSL